MCTRPLVTGPRTMTAPLTRALVVAAALLALGGTAHAARPFIHRDLVLPRNDVALDLGLGIGHAPAPPGPSQTGLGMNLALSAGLGNGVEIGARTGFRLNDEGQYTQADGYGRAFDTETYGTAGDRVANPELHVRWAMARGPSAELGFELRAIIPIESGSHFGMVLGLPVALGTGILRLDTGIYVPIIFQPNTLTIISVPAHLCIQVSPTVWLGPLFGIRVYNWNGGSSTQYPFGLGIGSMLSSNLDLRAWFLFPNLDRNDVYGGGIAFQIRFE